MKRERRDDKNASPARPGLVYEITAEMPSHLGAEFEEFMVTRHIPDLVSTGDFANALFTRIRPGRYRILYFAEDRTHLDEYLSRHAERLRTDFQTRFPDGVSVTRNILEVLIAHDGDQA